MTPAMATSVRCKGGSSPGKVLRGLCSSAPAALTSAPVHLDRDKHPLLWTAASSQHPCATPEALTSAAPLNNPPRGITSGTLSISGMTGKLFPFHWSKFKAALRKVPCSLNPYLRPERLRVKGKEARLCSRDNRKVWAVWKTHTELRRNGANQAMVT